jgi:aspartate carbamoyltransferase catalytic subunit
MQKQFGELRGLTVAIIGDILHSRVARSNFWALRKLGVNIVFCAPTNMRAAELDATYVTMDEALRADVVMMLRVQLERHESGMIKSAEEYREQYGLTAERVKRIGSHAIIMHPAPINRNVEIDDELVEHPQSRIFAQMQNGVPVRMAVIERALIR